MGGHLLKKQLLDPHWSKKQADVVALERATLYGLVVYNGRRVSYGRVDPYEARNLFIRQALVEGLRAQGFPVLDLTDNELAKLHIRHMVGGHAAGVGNEMVLRFEFPERPGALFNFLQKLGGRWNISMFHYRNHGAADGRVLAALQVPGDERHLVPTALDAIGYPYWDESDNPAYRLFLG